MRVVPLKRLAKIGLSSAEAVSLQVGDPVTVRRLKSSALAIGRIVRKNRDIAWIKFFRNFHLIVPGAVVLLRKEIQYKESSEISYLSRSRRWNEPLGWLGLQGDVVVNSEQSLLYGGTLAIQVLEYIDLEGSLAVGSRLVERVAIVEGIELVAQPEYWSISGRIRWFPVDYFSFFASFQNMNVREPRSLQLPYGGEVTSSAGDESSDADQISSPSFYADYGFIETGIGLRMDIRTFLIGKSFSIGMDGGLAYQVNVSNSTNISYDPFDHTLGVNGLVAFAKASVGLVF
jgi:hypothetical protein